MHEQDETSASKASPARTAKFDTTVVPSDDHEVPDEPVGVAAPQVSQEQSEKQPIKPSSRIRRFRDSDGWLWTEVAVALIGLGFIVPTGYALWVDLEDRKQQRIAQAWELVTRKTPGNGGKGPALEYLNNHGIPLTGIDLSTESNGGSTYLLGIDLSGADLSGANLSGADLDGANLSGANLGGANLSGVDLTGADISEAYLNGADLSGADIKWADLSGTLLRHADLSGAILGWAELSGTRLEATDLSGANFYRADL